MALTRTDASMGAQLSHGQLGEHTVHAADGAQVAAPQPPLKEVRAHHCACMKIMHASKPISQKACYA